MALDETKLHEFVGKMVGDMGGAMTAALMLIGDKLGLYKELAGGKLTSAELAKATGTTERYVREWLAAQAAALGGVRERLVREDVLLADLLRTHGGQRRPVHPLRQLGGRPDNEGFAPRHLGLRVELGLEVVAALQTSSGVLKC